MVAESDGECEDSSGVPYGVVERRVHVDGRLEKPRRGDGIGVEEGMWRMMREEGYRWCEGLSER